jgi:hypothetical protein
MAVIKARIENPEKLVLVDLTNARKVATKN